MTLVNPVDNVTAIGNGVTTVFPYAFNIPAADSIEVTIYDPSTFSETLLVEGVDYTVTGYGSDLGGNVTYTGGGSPLASPKSITIRRTPPLEQEVNLTNQSGFQPVALGSQLDKIVMMIQWLRTSMEKALVIPLGETQTPEALVAALLAYVEAGSGSASPFGTLVPAADATYDIGTAALRWLRIFLGTNGKIDWGNGNVIIQHSNGVITVSVGDLRVTTAGANTASVVTVGGTQSLSGKTLIAPRILDSGADHNYIFSPANLAANRNISLPLLTADDTLVFANFPQTLAFKALTGVIDGGAAAAGQVGEYGESMVLQGAAVALTSTLASNITSVTLSAGEYDVWGFCAVNLAATTSITVLRFSLSTVSATVSALADRYLSDVRAATVPGTAIFTPTIGPVRISSAGNTTLYLVQQHNFTVSTAAGFGGIRWRRVR